MSWLGGTDWWVLDNFCREWSEGNTPLAGGSEVWGEGGWNQCPEEGGTAGPAMAESQKDSPLLGHPARSQISRGSPQVTVWETTWPKTPLSHLHFDSSPPRSRGRSSQAKLQFSDLGCPSPSSSMRHPRASCFPAHQVAHCHCLQPGDGPAYPLDLLAEGKAVVVTQSSVGLRKPPCEEKAVLGADLPMRTWRRTWGEWETGEG